MNNDKINTKNDVFHDWNPREIDALKRATAQLRSKQPQKKELNVEKPNLKGCYYSTSHHCYIINIYDGKERIYAGRLHDWDRSKALKIQREASLNHHHAKNEC
jgi:hypothetical protein